MSYVETYVGFEVMDTHDIDQIYLFSCPPPVLFSRNILANTNATGKLNLHWVRARHIQEKKIIGTNEHVLKWAEKYFVLLQRPLSKKFETTNISLE